MKNREIKFRAWIENECVMHQVASLHNNKGYGGCYEIHVDNPNFNAYRDIVENDFVDDWTSLGFKSYVEKLEPFVLMQYTGLEDKNGVEIYEGDILEFGNRNPVEVIFDNGCFNVFDEPLGWDFDSQDIPIRTDLIFCEVIGNIHQNKDLLK